MQRRTKLSLGFVLLAVCAGALEGWAQSSVPVPEMARIPAGLFQMGSEEGASWEKPAHRVEVSEFWISKRPVTLREFRAFQPKHEATTTDESGGNPEEGPVTDVSREDAAAYCRWLSEKTGHSFRLATEAEWERAVRGGLEQKKYPWGDEPPVPVEKLDDLNYRAAPKPNAFGVIAAHRNLWEWTADWYDPEYYQKSPEKDPQGPESGQFRVLRGGGYRNDPNSVFNWNRGSARPQSATSVITFRVARGGPAAPPAVSEWRPSPPPAPVEAAAPGGPVQVRGIEVTRSPAETVIRLATSSRAEFKTMRLNNPERLVIDIRGSLLEIPAASRTVQVNHLGVVRVRSAQFSTEPPVARVVVDMERGLNFEVSPGAEALEVQLRSAP
jgi:formylglycine-generating enzyme required for sulfatase activity